LLEGVPSPLLEISLGPLVGIGDFAELREWTPAECCASVREIPVPITKRIVGAPIVPTGDHSSKVTMQLDPPTVNLPRDAILDWFAESKGTPIREFLRRFDKGAAPDNRSSNIESELLRCEDIAG